MHQTRKATRQTNYISNIAGGISVDQHIAQGLRRKGFQGRLSLKLGVSPGGFHSGWQGANQPLPADRDPYHAFKTIFGTGSGGMTNDQLRVRRRSILDYLKKYLGRITATVSGEDYNDKNEFLVQLGSSIVYKGIEFSDEQVRSEGDLAILTAKAKFSVSVHGTDAEKNSYVTRVFSKQKGQWRLAMHQAPPVHTPTPAAAPKK